MSAKRDLPALARAASGCRACPLWEPATQVVFGEGPSVARIVLVGEQPGDREDLAGRPFVGPAGHVLDDALADAGIQRTVAARSILGRTVTLSSLRDATVDVGGAVGVVTIHPSAVLRGQERRRELYDQLVLDLRRVAALAAAS